MNASQKVAEMEKYTAAVKIPRRRVFAALEKYQASAAKMIEAMQAGKSFEMIQRENLRDLDDLNYSRRLCEEAEHEMERQLDALDQPEKFGGSATNQELVELTRGSTIAEGLTDKPMRGLIRARGVGEAPAARPVMTEAEIEKFWVSDESVATVVHPDTPSNVVHEYVFARPFRYAPGEISCPDNV